MWVYSALLCHWQYTLLKWPSPVSHFLSFEIAWPCDHIYYNLIYSPALERRPNANVVTIRSQYSLRRRTPISVKTPNSARRVLVSLGRHKLRRVSPSSSITTPWSSRTGMFMNFHVNTVTYKQQGFTFCRAVTWSWMSLFVPDYCHTNYSFTSYTVSVKHMCPAPLLLVCPLPFSCHSLRICHCIYSCVYGFSAILHFE